MDDSQAGKQEAPEVEIYTPERKAEFLLNNSITKEGYDEACGAVRDGPGSGEDSIYGSGYA